MTVFLGSFFIEYFIFFQILYGVLNGFGVGIGYTLCIVTPQAWLDQKRAQLNGFILIGAPLGAGIHFYDIDDTKLESLCSS